MLSDTFVIPGGSVRWLDPGLFPAEFVEAVEVADSFDALPGWAKEMIVAGEAWKPLQM